MSQQSEIIVLNKTWLESHFKVQLAFIEGQMITLHNKWLPFNYQMIFHVDECKMLEKIRRGPWNITFIWHFRILKHIHAYLITNDKLKKATTRTYLMVQRMMPKTYEAQYLMHLHESIIGIWILSMNTDIG